MKVGITGHQERSGIDWFWVATTVSSELANRRAIAGALSSLAAGSDQLFAKVAIGLGIPVTAVIPMADYKRHFKPDALANYQALLSQCSVIELSTPGTDEAAFYAAGRYVVDHSDVLFAVWDGQAAQGLGGTADVVSYARQLGKELVHINPITNTVRSE